MGGADGLGPADGDDGVAFDDGQIVAALLKHAVVRHHLGAQGKGAHVRQDHLLDLPVTLLHGALQSRAQGHRHIRVDAQTGLLAEEPLHEPADHRRAGGSAHQDHPVDLLQADPGIPQTPLHGLSQPLQQGRTGRFILLQGQGHGVGLLPQVADHDDGGRIGKGTLAPLGGLADLRTGLYIQTLLCNARVGVKQVTKDLGKVLSAQEIVTGDGVDLHDGAVVLQNGHVKGAAAQIKDQIPDIVLLRHAVGDGGGGGLVDDAHHIQTRQLTGALGGLALVVVEVGRHGDDGIGDSLSQMGLGVLLQAFQNQAAELLRPEMAVSQPEIPVGAHAALEHRRALEGVEQSPLPGRLTDVELPRLVDADHRGGQHIAEPIGDQLRPAVAKTGDQGIGGSQIDSNEHRVYPFFFFKRISPDRKSSSSGQFFCPAR